MDQITARKLYYESIPNQSEPLLDKKYGMYFPNTGLTFEEQQKLIQVVKNSKEFSRGTYGAKDSSPSWSTFTVRGLEPSIIKNLTEKVSVNTAEFYLRHHPKMPWKWFDTEVTSFVQEKIKSILPIFDYITRVKIFLQVPGQRIHFHRDLSPGNYYFIQSAFTNFIGPTKQKYLGDQELSQVIQFADSDIHAQQGFFALKIPLSENENDYGGQTIVSDKPYYYFHNGQIYLMNEFAFHGSEVRPFYRGVVMVDGFISLSKLDQVHSLPLSIRPYQFAEEAE